MGQTKRSRTAKLCLPCLFPGREKRGIDRSIELCDVRLPPCFISKHAWLIIVASYTFINLYDVDVHPAACARLAKTCTVPLLQINGARIRGALLLACSLVLYHASCDDLHTYVRMRAGTWTSTWHPKFDCSWSVVRGKVDQAAPAKWAFQPVE